MSVCGKSVRSCLSRKSITLKGRLEESVKQTKVRFQLPHSQNVRTILEGFHNGTHIKEYTSLIVMLRDAELEDKEVHELLEEATQCISILNQNLKLFIEAILSLKWTQYSKSVILEYQSFLINLLCAHIYHCKSVVEKLVLNLFPGKLDW